MKLRTLAPWPHWTGWEEWIASASEVVAIVATGTVLLQENPVRSAHGLEQPPPGH